MERWEYLVRVCDSNKDLEQALDERGSDGWELVSVTNGIPTYNEDQTVLYPTWKFFFKRRLLKEM